MGLLTKVRATCVVYVEREPKHWEHATEFPDGTLFDLETLFEFGNFSLWDLRFILARVKVTNETAVAGTRVLLEARCVEEIWLETPDEQPPE